MDAADNVVEVADEHGVTRVRVSADDLPELVDLGSRWNADEVHSWHHHFDRRHVAELEQLAEHSAGFPAQQPTLLALLDDELQFVRRVVTLRFDFLPPDADQAQ